MKKCPVCGVESEKSYCENCGWDFTSDICMFSTAGKVTEEYKKQYAEKFEIAKNNLVYLNRQAKTIPPFLSDKIGKKMHLICVDFGRTRLKVGLIKIEGSKLGIVKNDVLHKEVFSGSNGFNFFVDTIENYCQDITVEGIAICIGEPLNYYSAETFDNRFLSIYGWEESLNFYMQRLKKFGRIEIFNDAVAFSYNALFLPMKLPSLCLTFGSGVGTAIITETGDESKCFIQPLESFEEKDWRPLNYTGCIHSMAGNRFFEYVQSDTDWDAATIKNQFSIRASLIISEIAQKHNNFKNVIIGGGYSDFLNINGVEREFKEQEMSVFKEDPALGGLFGCAMGWCMSHFTESKISDQIKPYVSI